MNFHVPQTRFCNICGASSQEARFYQGVTSRCANCHMRKVRENRAANIDYYRAYDAKRFQEDPSRRAANELRAKTPKGIESIKRARKKWLALNMVKRKAHLMVASAVKSGKLTKPANCQVCGNKHRRIHGHHDDYSRPLEVLWVCPKCHMDLHR